MEAKTIADWESEKKTTSSELTDRDRLEEARVNLEGSRILTGFVPLVRSATTE